MSNLVVALAVAMAAYGGAWVGFSSPVNQRFLQLALWLMALPLAAYFLDRLTGVFARGDNVTIFNPAVLGGRDMEYVLWPLAVMTNGQGGFLPELGPRLTAWFGEPGLYAAVFALLAAIDLVRRNRFGAWQVAAACGVVAAQSSGGVAAYFAMMSAWLLTRPARSGRRGSLGLRIIGLGAALASVWAVTSASVGLAGKETANATSVADRLGNLTVIDVLHTWIAAPLGGTASNLTEINLLGSSLVYGPMVVVFAALIIVVWPMRLGVARPLAPVSAVLAVTLMFSQPAFANPLWFAMLAFAVAWFGRRVTGAADETCSDQEAAEVGADDSNRPNALGGRS